MLLSLDIQNAALIEHLVLEIHNGLTVLTGETGAGKSVIIDSVNLIMGARAGKNIVRHGEKKAVIQAMFYLEDTSFLDEYGICAEDNEIIITREITNDGKSILRVNGIMLPQSVVREIAQGLINIHGQQDSQELLNPSKHIDYLDFYAKNEEELSEYLSLYEKRTELREKINSYQTDEAEKERKIDLLTYQTEEIRKANISIGEKESLKEERILIQNGEKISEALNSAYEFLYNGNSCAYDSVSGAAESLSKISDIDSAFNEFYGKICDIQYTLEDIAHDIYNKASEIDYDEERLNDIEERLDTITKLERKYGGSEEATLQFLRSAEEELLKITDSDGEIKKLTEELSGVEKLLSASADKLSEKRRIAAEKLGCEIEKELSELDMPKVRFSVSVEKCDYTKKGTDKVEFLICPNFGEPMKPLDKIASGGELSRVMLAIKSILADSDKVETLIFDEIDTGVSGSAAKKIARKLFSLGEKKQVICVSHQPQIAASGDNHYKIIKKEIGERTITEAHLLEREERAEEIARIIDGDNITKTSLEHATELLGQYKRG